MAPHADQAPVLDGTSVDDGPVPDTDPVADRTGHVLVHVDDGPVLDVGLGSRPGSGAMSPRSTAVYHTLDSAPMVTSPSTTAPGARKAEGWMVGKGVGSRESGVRSRGRGRGSSWSRESEWSGRSSSRLLTHDFPTSSHRPEQHLGPAGHGGAGLGGRMPVHGQGVVADQLLEGGVIGRCERLSRRGCCPPPTSRTHMIDGRGVPSTASVSFTSGGTTGRGRTS